MIETLGYFIAWVAAGYFIFLINTRIDDNAKKIIEEQPKTMVVLILLWPLLLFGLVQYIYRLLRHAYKEAGG